MTVPDLLENLEYDKEKVRFRIESWVKKRKGFRTANDVMKKHPLTGYGHIIRIHGVYVDSVLRLNAPRSDPAMYIFKEFDNTHAFYIRSTKNYHWTTIKTFLDDVYPTLKQEDTMLDYLKPMILLASI